MFKGVNKLHPNTVKLHNLKGKDKIEVMSHNSKYWNHFNILSIALLLKDQTLYFPTFLDFRGRIYPTPNYLSYQSSDLARSLLLFSEIGSDKSSSSSYKLVLKEILKDKIYNPKTKVGKKLKQNIDYVKLYLANVYGYSKYSRKDKIQWFDNNIGDMTSTYKSSLNTFIEKYVQLSKEPFQFLSIFISYYNYTYSNLEIKNPILFDATCSGIQHLSALTKNSKTANLVNLLQNESPSDFYHYCIEKIVEEIGALEDIKLRDKYNKLHLSRKLLKQSIMTVPYNVTAIGIADKLGDKYNKYYLEKAELDKLEGGLITLEQTIENNLLKSKKQQEEGKTPVEILVINHEEEIEELLEPETLEEKPDKGTYIYVPYSEILLCDGPIYFTSKEQFKLAKIVHSTVLNAIPAFIQLKQYFDRIIQLLSKLDLPLS